MNLDAILKPKPPVAMAVLTLLVLALALPGIRSMPVTDRDEARYAQASKQMVESGDYVQIRFLDEARNKKPAGIYWLHAASVHLTGTKDEIWPYRLVSVAGALLAVLLIYLLARRIQPEAPLLPAVALAACPLLVCVSHAAVTDAVVLATVCAAQLCLARVYLERGVWNAECGVRSAESGVGEPESSKCGVWDTGNHTPDSARRTPHSAPLLPALGFWIALGIGILVKGPITPLIAGLTILALCLHDRSFRWLRGLRPAIGILLLLLIVLPWLVAIQRKTNFLQESMGKDFLTKMQGAQESHGAPPGAYLAAASFLFWPLFPLAWRGIGRAWLTRRADPASLFLLAWLVPSWLVFELAPTKLPHYVLPLYPVLAFLAVRGWANQRSRQEGGGEPNFVGNFVVSFVDKVHDEAHDKDAQQTNRVAVSLGERIWRFTCHIADVAWWLAAALFIAGPVLAARVLGWEWMPMAFGCAAVAGVAAAVFRRRQGAALQASSRKVAIAAGFALLYFGILFAFVLPRMGDLWLTRKVAGMVDAQTHGQPARVVSVGYTEPSMAFTFGSQTILSGGEERAVQELQRNPAAVVLVQDAPARPPRLLPVGDACWEKLSQEVAASPKQQHRERFLAAAAQAGVRVREVASVDGLNYSRTKRVRVILYVRENPGVRNPE